MANTYRTVNLTAGAGVDDKKIKVSVDDKQHEFIEQKLLPGSSRISITVQNPGLIERLLVDADETQIDHNNLLNYDIDEHRPLDDSSTTNTSLWSSTKIQTELDLKVNGPATSTDNAITRFDGTNGDIQNSGILIDDLNNMTGVNDLTINGDLQVLGTLTAIQSSETNITDANITVNKGGTQATADSQVSGITVEMSDATDVVLGYDSTTVSKMVVGELGSESEIVTVDHVQTLNNKTITFDPTGSTLSSTTLSDALKELDLDKANTDLGNLQAHSSGQYTFYSDITFNQGGNPIIIRGKAFAVGEASEDMFIFSGATEEADSGSLQAFSGNVFGTVAANSGPAWFKSGQIVDAGNSGNSGYVALSTGSVQSGTSGDVFIFSGSAYDGGNRGRILLDAPVIDVVNGQLNVRDGFINLLDVSSNVSNRIINLANPIDNQDAATKLFVDTEITNLDNSLNSYVDSQSSNLEQELRVYSDIQDLELKDELTSEGDVFESQSGLLESQSGASVSGLSFDSLIVRSFSVLVSVEIDADADLHEEFEIHGINKGSSWEISYESTGDDSLVIFDIDNTGQVLYSSNLYTGFTSGSIKYRSITTTI